MSKELPAEAYLVQTPDTDEVYAFQIAAQGGEINPMRHDLYALAIRHLINFSGVLDAEADVLGHIYDSGKVPREVVGAVEMATQALDPAEDLVIAVFNMLEQGRVDGTIAEVLIDAIYLQEGPERERTTMMLLTNSGINISYIDDGLSFLTTEKPVRETFSDDIVEVAEELGAGSIVFQDPIVWRQGEDGKNYPERLLGRSHYLLLRNQIEGEELVTADAIEPIATILNPDHPARSLTPRQV